MCYEWFDREEKLESQEPPPYEAFYSSLKLSNVLHEEFQGWQEEVAQCQTEDQKKKLEKRGLKQVLRSTQTSRSYGAIMT